MQEKQTMLQKISKTKRADSALEGILGALSRALGRVTDGFWEAVVRSLCRTDALSAQFLSILLFFTFSGIVALAALAAFPFEVFPVPLALLGALGTRRLCVGKKEYSAFGFCASVLLGVLFAALFLPSGGVLLFFSLGLFAVLLTVGKVRRDSVLFRSLLVGALAVVQTLCIGLVFSFPYDFFLGSVFSAGVFSAALCVLFSGVFVHEKARGGAVWALLPSQLELYRFLSVLALFACALGALSETHLLGFSPALVAAFLCALFAARRLGALHGILSAVVLGFAAANATASVALAVGVLAAAFGASHSKLLTACLSFLTSCGFLLSFASADSFGLFAADLLLAELLFFALSALLDSGRVQTQEPAQLAGQRAKAALQQKLSRLSEAFTSLSEVFYMATDKSLSEEGQLAARLVREASECVCARCQSSTDCWQQNYGLTQSALTHISGLLCQKREIAPSDLEPYFRSRCHKAEELCQQINRRYAAACAAHPGKEALPALLCGEYGSVARLLSGEAEQLRREEAVNGELSRRAEALLCALGIRHRAAYVSGGRDVVLTVTGVCLSALNLSTDRLLIKLEEALGVSFDEPEFTTPLTDSTMTLRRRRVVRLSCARLVRAAGMQPVSGDTTGFFESDMGFFYSLICDGMGSGRSAAFTSRLSSIFIEKLLTFSREKGVTLEMLNRFLLAQKEERFSTVDLLEIDFYTARANFIKAGAAASYVKRGTGLYRIASKTPPAGILGEISAEQTSLTLSDGDCVVMFSDGVTPNEESDAWFAETLAFSKEKDPRALADYLMREARRHHGAPADDMSISVLQVHAA